MYRTMSLWVLMLGLPIGKRTGYSHGATDADPQPQAAGAERAQPAAPRRDSGAALGVQPSRPEPICTVDDLVYFACDDEPWETVLHRLADELGLVIRMDAPPPGRFTYRSPKGYSKEGALELVHGVLLDRGITIVRHRALLQVLRLADELHWDLVPHIALDELPAQPATRIVQVAIPLRSLLPSAVERELEPMLSPRGRLVGVQHARRLVVCDQVRIVRMLVRMLAELDPATNAPGAHLRVFVLRFAPASDVLFVARELLGGASAQAAPTPPIDFARLGRQLGTNEMIEAFIPGFSMPGIVPDAPREKLPARLALDRRRNAVLVSGEPEVLAMVARVVATLDAAPIVEPVPEVSQPASPGTVLRERAAGEGSTPAPPPQVAWIALAPRLDAAAAARLLEHLFRVTEPASQAEILVKGDGYLLVRGSREQLAAARRLVGHAGEYRPLGAPAAAGDLAP